MDRYGYSRVDKEDPEDVKHRKAQFLIYKSMERADTMQKKPLSGLRVRVSKLKIKIGRKLKMMKKSVLLTMSSAKGGVYKQFMTTQLRLWKRLVHGGHAMVTLPPVFKC